MNDNYLWDQTGEPDKEVRQLEELLGELRYQPRPLQIPNSVRIGRRNFVPALAIAATLLIAVAIGIWLNLNRRAIAPPPDQARAAQPAQPSTPPRQNAQGENLTATVINPPKPNKPERHQVARSFTTSKHQRSEIREPQLTAQELAQKEQVVLALRMVSTKLNLAQRKTQGVPQTNIIRNQHKIG